MRGVGRRFIALGIAISCVAVLLAARMQGAEPAGEKPKTPAVKNETKTGDRPQTKSEAKPEEAKPDEGLGDPLAPALVTSMVQEIRSGFRIRGVEDDFARFCGYNANKLNSTAGPYTGSEITGNCRLKWFDRMLRNPLVFPGEAEQFTRELHAAFRNERGGLDEVLRIARGRMDLGTREPSRVLEPKSPQEALEMVNDALSQAQLGYAASLAPLGRGEVAELVRYLVPTFNGRKGHTLEDRGTGRRLADLMERMDRSGWYDAADALAELTSPEVLKQLAALPEDGNVHVEGATGKIVRQILVPGGSIVIGGRGPNTYDLDAMAAVSAIIDLGGDDVYQEGTVNFQRPVLVILDLGGNDKYQGSRPGIQGGAVVGVSMLVDVSGNDVYRAQDVAQGAALCGVGMLIDLAGNDDYAGIRRVQASALGGIGLLLDRAGHDKYRAAMWAQGYGGPLGFGILDDIAGDDYYYAGGLYPDSYPETPGYEGWSQGVGSGLRQVACGGLGVILDGAGDDVYEFDYIGHGGGYWLGMGFARDFGGNDQRFGGTRVEYGGGPRREQMFQRFGCGFGCHCALGCLFDDSGNDTYGGTIMGSGFAWDEGVGFLCDFGGDDRFEATGGATQGNGAQAGLGVIFNYRGNDTYFGYTQGYANSGITYHPVPACGGNFSFVIDYGGKDSYGCGVPDNSYNQRGAAGGFVIDRALPGDEGSQPAGDKQPAADTAGS